ncbi:MAG: MarR family winged helix-turn-helix transcriptional regulator [Coriobacteriales bacterium]|jgi:DNA-binding MarR family transcriptional regulator
MQRFDGVDRFDSFAAVCAFGEWHKATSSFLYVRHGITLLQYWILLILSHGEGGSIKELQKTLELNYTTVNESIAALEHMLLIEKSRSLDDGRVRPVCLTKQGCTVLEECDYAVWEFIAHAWTGFSEVDTKRALMVFYNACRQQDKSRDTGTLIRGDSAFVIMCAQFMMKFQKACKDIPVTVSQAQMLMLLERHPRGMQPKEIGKVLSRNPYAVSKAISHLVSSGLVEEAYGATKREKVVTLSEDGHSRALRAKRAALDIMELHFGWVEDVGFLNAVLQELSRHLPNQKG